MNFEHFSVMSAESVEALAVVKDGIYFDCTLGGCGHTRLILNELGDNGRVIGIDRDEAAIENARETLDDKRFTAVKSNFSEVTRIAASLGIEKINGAIIDLGVSSYQLDTAERGFSYLKDAPLDMRMDRESSLTAYKVVNTYSADELTRVLFDYGEEKFSRRIVAAIIARREIKPIETTLELASVIEQAMPAKSRYEGGHPAKRSFQAIRIEVNDELNVIAPTLEALVNLLVPGGRISVISFHSLEDRIVKTTFARLVSPCTCPRDFPVCVCGKKPLIRLISKKPLLPSEGELEINTRSHSAKLRAAERL